MDTKILIQLYTMYSNEIWDCGWIHSNAWMNTHPANLSFEDWLVDRLSQDVKPMESMNIEDMPAIIEAWRNAVTRLTQRLSNDA